MLFTTVIGLAILNLAKYALLNLPQSALATVRCEEVYGGGEVCIRTGELRLDKWVWDPDTAQWVNDLGIHDYKFGPGEEITFKVRVKNEGDETLGKIDVRDYLPSYVNHLSGDLSYEIHNLDPDESVEREIRVEVVPAEEIPDDDTSICVVNTAEAWGEGEKDKDTAQVCIEKKVLGVKALPPTGPANWYMIIPFSLLAGAVGLYLRKSNN